MIRRTLISYFDSIFKSTKKTITLDQYFDWVKKGISSEHGSNINKLRELYSTDREQYQERKKLLRAVTISSRIRGKRSDSSAEEHTGLIAIDVDDKSNDQTIIEKFNDPEALAWHRSISGLGMVVYYRINCEGKVNDSVVNLHRAAFVQLSAKLKKMGLTADKATGSISQFRYISFDRNIKINWKAPVYMVDIPNQTEDKGLDEASTIEEVVHIVDQIEKQKLSILNNYEDWIKIGAVIWRISSGSKVGFDCWHRLSKLSEGYKSEADCKKKWAVLGRPNSNPAGLGTLVKMVKDVGGNVYNQVPIKQLKPVNSELSWRDYLVTKEPPPEEVLIKFQDINVCTVGNHTLVVGKKKSRKSLFVSWMISQYEYPDQIAKDIMIADTEQGLVHVWKMRKRVQKVTGHLVNVLYLRGEQPKVRMKILKQAVAEAKPKVLVIDGIRDLLFDINDPKESTEVVTWIEKLTVDDGVHVINVLHLNKTDQNARGHIGSELLNKAETTIELELDQKNDLTIVKCESSRGIPFETFAFSHDLHGLPKLCELPSKITGKLNEDDTKKKLVAIFKESDSDELKYQELIDGIRIHFQLGHTRAKQFIAELQFKSMIIGQGKPRSPLFRYRLPE